MKLTPDRHQFNTETEKGFWIASHKTSKKAINLNLSLKLVKFLNRKIIYLIQKHEEKMITKPRYKEQICCSL
jgi:hypothetical protein